MTMAEFLGTEEDKEVRRMLVNGISSVQNNESTQVLGQVIKNEPDPEIRLIAIRALGQRTKRQRCSIVSGTGAK